MIYPKVINVVPLDNYNLEVRFSDHKIKIYDLKPWLSHKDFYQLKNIIFFKSVKVESGGHGISWNDEIDLSESELWLNGKNA